MAEWNPPKVCPAGHAMEPPYIQVGWVRCSCHEPGETGKPPGHRTVACLRCPQEWREGGCEVEGVWHRLDWRPMAEQPVRPPRPELPEAYPQPGWRRVE